jgi:hypothetical protein
LRHGRPAGRNQRCQAAAFADVGNQDDQGNDTLWVWLSVALLAIGALTYETMVYFVEYIVGFF